MILILDGISEIGARVRGNLCYLISLRHLIRSRAVTNKMCIHIFLYACANASELPSDINTLDTRDKVNVIY